MMLFLSSVVTRSLSVFGLSPVLLCIEEQHPQYGGSSSECPACAEPEEDWGAAALAQALYTVSNDVTRVQTLLPELSPADRWLTSIIR